MSVLIPCSVGEVLSDLVLLVIVSELGLWHNIMSHWHIYIVGWHCVQPSPVTPVVSKHLKSINLLKPLFSEQLGVNLLGVNFLGLVIEFLCINDVLRLSLKFILVIRVNIIQIKCRNHRWVVLALVQKGLFVQQEKFIESDLGVN